jgi:membrane-bound inhibitor of C-type lysozyme
MFVRSLFLVLAVAGCANEVDPEAAAADSIPAAAMAPRLDTLMHSVNHRCANGTEVRANIYVGSAPRAVLAAHDTGMVLPRREAASGSRYATEDGAIVWWDKGDSASLTFRGVTTTCGPADDVVF